MPFLHPNWFGSRNFVISRRIHLDTNDSRTFMSTDVKDIGRKLSREAGVFLGTGEMKACFHCSTRGKYDNISQ